MEFLGHVIGKDGVQIDPTKVEAVTQMGEPTDIAQLRRFLGMVNQVGKYIPNLADITKPQQKAFDDVKKALVSAPKPSVIQPKRQGYHRMLPHLVLAQFSCKPKRMAVGNLLHTYQGH